MEEFKPQPNGYSDQAPQLTEKGLNTISLPIEKPLNNLAYDGDSSVLVSGSIRSKNFKSGISGWRLNENGSVEINSAVIQINSPLISSHFRLHSKDINTGVSIYTSDGTTANGNLTGVVGDICFNGGSHKPEYCSTAPTTWTALV